MLKIFDYTCGKHYLIGRMAHKEPRLDRCVINVPTQQTASCDARILNGRDP